MRKKLKFAKATKRLNLKSSKLELWPITGKMWSFWFLRWMKNVRNRQSSYCKTFSLNWVLWRLKWILRLCFWYACANWVKYQKYGLTFDSHNRLEGLIPKKWKKKKKMWCIEACLHQLLYVCRGSKTTVLWRQNDKERGSTKQLNQTPAISLVHRIWLMLVVFIGRAWSNMLDCW